MEKPLNYILRIFFVVGQKEPLRGGKNQNRGALLKKKLEI
jgi:hypothetical protein